MFNNPYNGYGGYPPQQPIVFIPPQQTGQQDPVTTISTWITGLEALKKGLKEEKKEDKKDGKKDSDVNVLNMALLMVLLSPITGPIMSHFFQWGLSLLPH